MAAAINFIEYPITYDSEGSLIFETSKLENHLIQLNYNQTDVLRLTGSQILKGEPGSVIRTIRVRLQNNKKEEVKYCDLNGLIGHNDLLRMLLLSLNEGDRIRLFQTDDTTWPLLHLVACNYETEIMKTILELVREDQHYDLLCVHEGGPNKWTLLHLICIFNKPDALEVIMQLTSDLTRYELLQIPDRIGYTPLHWAAGRRRTEYIRIIADSVTSKQLIHLLRIPGREDGRTPLQTAAANNEQESLKVLQDYQTKALIDMAILQTDQTVREEQVQQIIELEPLSPGQIEELSPYSPQYLIPHNQTKTKRYGLILYSTEQRNGAEEEADNFKHALETAGCDVTKLEWSHTEELSSMIDSSLEGVIGDCSLLIIAVMTHGYRGALTGSDDSQIPINNILFQLSNTLPKNIPLVMVIQACQMFTTHGVVQPQDYESDPATPSKLVDPHSNKHIVLRRPHTVLLLATVTGGLAIRGAFTGALADQIRAADGKTDIYSMFNRAVNNMLRNEPACVGQTPEFKATTDKNLILPKISNNDAT